MLHQTVYCLENRHFIPHKWASARGDGYFSDTRPPFGKRNAYLRDTLPLSGKQDTHFRDTHTPFFQQNAHLRDTLPPSGERDAHFYDTHRPFHLKNAPCV